MLNLCMFHGMWERSLVQADSENTYCLHSLSLTGACLKCITKSHSQVKMQAGIIQLKHLSVLGTEFLYLSRLLIFGAK